MTAQRNISAAVQGLLRNVDDALGIARTIIDRLDDHIDVKAPHTNIEASVLHGLFLFEEMRTDYDDGRHKNNLVEIKIFSRKELRAYIDIYDQDDGKNEEISCVSIDDGPIKTYRINAKMRYRVAGECVFALIRLIEPSSINIITHSPSLL
jgi:hypothetical protein